MPRAPYEYYEKTDDMYCPQCDDDGRDKAKVCHDHRWCNMDWYEEWLERWRAGLAR